jgi:hypothetical protein
MKMFLFLRILRAIACYVMLFSGAALIFLPISYSDRMSCCAAGILGAYAALLAWALLAIVGESN